MGLTDTYEPLGGYVESLPEHLRESYLKSLGDPQLEGLKHESAILATLIKARLEKLSQDAPAMRWQRAIDILEETVSELPEEYREGFDAVKDELMAVRDYQAVEKELRKLVQERSVVVTVESQRLARLKQYISKDQLVFRIGQMAGACRVVFQNGIARNLSLTQVRDDFIKALMENMPHFTEEAGEEALSLHR